MNTSIKKTLPYFLTSIFVVGFWWITTEPSNYAWNPKGKELFMLDVALTSIFFYKTVFWLIVANLTVYACGQAIKKNFKSMGVTAFLTVLLYFLAGTYVEKKCAFHYMTVFQNQSVSEEHIDRPILEAGYQIGSILTVKMSDKEMKHRRYAISGLEKLKYRPATQTLAKILLDKSETGVFRADAYAALKAFDTDETRKILADFKNKATGSDEKAVELGESFIKSK